MGRRVVMVLVPRYDGYHHLYQTVVFDRVEPFQLKPLKVKAVYPRAGVCLHIILRRSQIDDDFQLPSGYVDWVISQQEYELIGKALAKSDELTADLLGKPGWGGKRPFASTKLHHYM